MYKKLSDWIVCSISLTSNLGFTLSITLEFRRLRSCPIHSRYICTYLLSPRIEERTNFSLFQQSSPTWVLFLFAIAQPTIAAILPQPLPVHHPPPLPCRIYQSKSYWLPLAPGWLAELMTLFQYFSSPRVCHFSFEISSSSTPSTCCWQWFIKNSIHQQMESDRSSRRTAEVHQKPVPFYGSRKQISSVCAGYSCV